MGEFESYEKQFFFRLSNILSKFFAFNPTTLSLDIQGSHSAISNSDVWVTYFFSLPTSQFNFTSSTSFNTIVPMFPCLTWCLCGLSFPWSSMTYCIVQWREREFRATLASSGFVVYFAVSSMPWQSRFHGSDQITLSIWLVGLFLLWNFATFSGSCLAVGIPFRSQHISSLIIIPSPQKMNLIVLFVIIVKSNFSQTPWYKFVTHWS